jgi:CheY-like chemotaxis protein
MKILVLDDNEKRLTQFRQNLIGHTVACVKTAEETINRLATEEWSCLFLDHDLGDKVMVPSGPGTGYEVAEWLEQNPTRQPDMIFIHSFNTVGAANIKRALPKAIIAPGAWTQLKNGGLA